MILYTNYFSGALDLSINGSFKLEVNFLGIDHSNFPIYTVLHFVWYAYHVTVKSLVFYVCVGKQESTEKKESVSSTVVG